MWFVQQYLDDNDLPGVAEEPGVLTDTEAEFVAELRRHAAAWTVPGADTFVVRPDEGAIAAVVRIAGCAWGGHLSGGSLYCGMLHNQLYYPLPDYFDGHLTATGDPIELARETAGWIEALLRRPVVKHQWAYRERVYREECLFADTGQMLWSGGDRSAAPWSSILKKGWGLPDRVVRVRN